METTFALEDVFKQLFWELKGICIDDQLVDLKGILTDPKNDSAQVGLNMNMDKTKIMTSELKSIQVDGKTIDKVEEYIYLLYLIKLGKENQQAETTRRIRMTRAAVGRLTSVLKDS